MTKTNKPRISVIIPVYNAENTLTKCLEAISKSDYQDYESIVVDDGSDDHSVEIASQYADKVIRNAKNLGRINARKSGMSAAKGDILINIDSDVGIKADTLSRIAGFFDDNGGIGAVTGKLTKVCPCPGYFSQYKNLYMHYIFSKLPERVSFLYGSIYAVRRELAGLYDSEIPIADDTEFGQKLYEEGHSIAFLKDLEVTHIKRFSFLSWVKNDFTIPFDWARIFIKKKAWLQLGKNKTGFAHSPKEQLVSVMLAPLIVFLVIIGMPSAVLIGLLLVWSVLNVRFIQFLAKEKGFWFGFRSVFVTFLDHLVMEAGIICGFLVEIWQSICEGEK